MVLIVNKITRSVKNMLPLYYHGSVRRTIINEVLLPTKDPDEDWHDEVDSLVFVNDLQSQKRETEAGQGNYMHFSCQDKFL